MGLFLLNEFYDLRITNFVDKEYAFCELPDDMHATEPSPKCPKCGSAIGKLRCAEPIKVILSKPKYGDFVYGLELLVSDKFKNAYENDNIKGITKFKHVDVIKIRYLGKKSLLPPPYYAIEVVYRYARIDLQKSNIKGSEISSRYCDLCYPFRFSWDEINSIYIDDTNWAGEDIFHMHEMGSAIYLSQKFVNFCKKNELTNLKCINTKEFLLPPLMFR